MRKIRKILLTIFLLLFCYWVAKKVVFPSMKNIFSSKPIVIDETPILIKEVKSIGPLITYTSFDEVVADTTIMTRGSAFVNGFNRLAHIPMLPPADKQLVLIGRGKVLAGTNLLLMTDTSISIKNDTLRIRLPKTQILDAILNPSDFETFVEKGEWADNEVTAVKLQARRKMIEHAIQQNILPKADTKSKAIMENFLQNMGYRHILFF